MLNLRHISLAAVLVLTTGMTGCNDNTNTTVAKSNIPAEANLLTETVDRAVATIKAYALDNTKTAPTLTDYKNAGIRGVTATNVASVNAQLDNLVFLFTDDVVPKVQAVVDTIEILKKIGDEHQDHNATITVAQLQSITPALENINSNYENIYQTYIASADTHISAPATVDELQSMIDYVNSLNLPTNAILDRSFFKKTNGKFEHKFVYLPVTNPKTGRTWLNNNLGAEYADVTSRYFDPSQQATTSNDYRAYGSLFEWGRKADGHELIDWNEDGTTGEPLYGMTTTKADEPSNSLWIISDFSMLHELYDWRVHQDDTLWASESSPNNVCPVGYRLPLNPNGVSDGKNEWFVEMSTWDAPDANGSMSSYLKLPYAGDRYFSSGQMRDAAEYGEYWTGSDYRSQAYNIYFGKGLDYNDYNSRTDGLSVRCIKDQAPAERSDSILKKIGNEHQDHNATITVAQLKAITPALENINSNYENIYRIYIAGADTNISSPATIEELQSMIDEVNALNLPTNAILDRNFYKKTNGKFEHKFVYLPVTNPKTGRTWLNNNLGAEYADVTSTYFDPSQQATTSNDYRAYGSLFEWGRKADGHELIDWNEDGTTGEPLYSTTTTKADEPSNSLWIISNFSLWYDWRVHRDDTLWASESSANNVCPVGYRLPLNPNGVSDGKNEWFVEMSTWDAPDANGSMSSYLKLPYAGYRDFSSAQMRDAAEYGEYWTGSDYGSHAYDIYFGKRFGYNDNGPRSSGFSVRCIKEQTPAERSASILLEIGNEHHNHKSTVTVAQLKAITPALNRINNSYENIYRSYIEGDTHFSFPATRDEVQQMITEVQNLNLPKNAILDRSFFKKTNGKFEHRFVYFPVTNSNTGRTWLNNNLGADYANLNSSDYNPSQQATTSNDHLAYGSLFQWGRKADGHELFDWTGATAGTAKHGDTDVTNDNPSDSLFIKQRNWRVNPNDTLWASESSANNVCPVGYRLPLNPNGAVDAENELVIELNSWDSKDADGSMLSDLKLPMAGGRKTNGDRAWTASYGIYWSGSVVPSDGNNSTVSNARDIYFGRALGLLDTSARGYGLSVRCIKDQTPAERSASILLEIGNEHRNHKSTVTVAQLRAITPALENINNSYENTYRSYIEGDTHFSSPATRDEVQQMITEVQNLNLPKNAILDRSFFKKTNGKFEHRFVYLAVTNPNTGRTWLNNNLGAEYANKNSSDYNPSQQATTSNDHLAYGSLFQWGRKADGHELFDWTGATAGTAKHGDTDVTNDNPSDSLFIKQRNWRVNPNDTLWASESSANNVCPVGYRLPLNPNGAVDAENELVIELNSWDSKDADGSMLSDLKLPMAGGRKTNGDRAWTASYGIYWSGSVVPSDGNNSTVSNARDIYFGRALGLLDTSARGYGLSVRCIKDQTPAERSASILLEIGNEHRNHKSTVTVAQLRAITPALENINNSYENTYRSYIEGDTHFSSPATRDEVQQMITEVQNLNLPKNAILDRSFFKKTNGKFEHRFVYLAVTNPNTGRTWLNNNLGAEYANKNSSDYNPSQQATTSNDHLAYGSLFQWGRKADGHELNIWYSDTYGTKKYGRTSTKANEPDNSSYIIGSNDWRVTSDDTLWASKSSKNNVCPVGYRLPLDPNGANDGANEWYQETQTWSSKDPSGAISSVLRLPMSGYSHYWSDDDIVETGNEASYWFGSAKGSKAKSMDFYPNNVYSNANSVKTYGFNVRCIKEQTPAEKKTSSTLAQIGREHNSAKSTITIAQLKAILPALENINDDYENIYRTYIASADTNIGSPATIEELQHMIDEVNSFNLPEHALLDRSFFKKTNGVFEHRFVYLPVTNPNTGRTWLNNNLGADYANVDSSAYNASHQATAIDDRLAYGSLFQWGRKADGHELINWTEYGTKKYGYTFTKSNEPGNSLYIIDPDDWRVHRDDTLWASESSKNNVCPVGYRLPLDPNGADDDENEWYQETRTWSSKNPSGAISSVLKLPISGYIWSGAIRQIGDEASYWFGSPDGSWAKSLNFYPKYAYSNENSPRTFGFNVRCIKDQTPAERSESILLVIGNQHSSGKSAITIAQLKAITPALKNINDKYESNYRHYIVSTSTYFSSPATRDEVQSMIDTANLSLSHLTKLGSYDTAGYSTGIILSSDGTKAYIADYDNGLVIVDISDPAHPTELGSYNTDGFSIGVTLSSDGTKAYIADGRDGLVIVDISDPAHPIKLGTYNTAGHAYNVTLSSNGQKAYIADWENGLVIVDISDPAHPTKLGTYDTAGYTEDVTLSNDGTKAYLADYENGLVIVDISDPTHPTKLGSYDTAGWSAGVALSSDDTKAYIADSGNGLVIVDISDPAHATKLGSYDIDGVHVYAYNVTLSSDGTKAYVAADEGGLVIVDISDPSHLIKLNSYDTAGYAYNVTLSRDGTKAYIADGENGLVIIGGIK